MFETSVVKARVAAQRRVSVLTASIAAHTIVIAGVIVASVSSVAFPTRAPNETLPLISLPTVEIPKPLGNPNAARHQVQQAQQKPVVPPHVQTAPSEITTPTTIPDTIAPVSALTGDATSGNTTASTGEQWGDPNGDPNGIDVGQPDATGPGIGVPDVVYHAGADVKSATVLFRRQPVYPPVAVRAKIPGWVIVRCIIGKDGAVRESQIVSSSSAMFNQSALDSLRGWKFAPGYFRGQAVDTYFELKITFYVQ